MADNKREPLLTVREVGAYLRLSASAAYRAAAEMRHFKVGARILVPQSALDEYLAKRAKEPVTWDAAADGKPRRQRAVRGKAPVVTAPNQQYEHIRIVYPRTKPRQTN